MSAVTTHILDTSLGLPVAAVAVQLDRKTQTGEWELVAKDTTNADGRVAAMPLPARESPDGAEVYRLSFAVASYFEARAQQAFYPEVRISFQISDRSRHTHVPLLLSPFGYSTYRGS